MAITPAGAQVNQSVSKQWKKIFKKNIQPQTDKRYYTKKKTRQSFVTKSNSAAGDAAAQAGATAAANAATDAKLGNYWTKAEADGKYAPYPKTLRGTYLVSETAVAGQQVFGTIPFGATLATAPTVVFKPAAGPANPNCTGTAVAPEAAPGFMCIYESAGINSTGFLSANAAGGAGASPFGVQVRITAVGAGQALSLGGWAVTPANGVTAGPSKPGKAGSNADFLGN